MRTTKRANKKISEIDDTWILSQILKAVINITKEGN